MKCSADDCTCSQTTQNAWRHGGERLQFDVIGSCAVVDDVTDIGDKHGCSGDWPAHRRHHHPRHRRSSRHLLRHLWTVPQGRGTFARWQTVGQGRSASRTVRHVGILVNCSPNVSQHFITASRTDNFIRLTDEIWSAITELSCVVELCRMQVSYFRRREITTVFRSLHLEVIHSNCQIWKP